MPRAVAQIPAWDLQQEGVEVSFPLSWRVIARNPRHMVPLDRPDVIVAEILALSTISVVGRSRLEIATCLRPLAALPPKNRYFAAIVSNIAHSEVYLRAYCDTNSELLAQPRGPRHA